MSRTLLFDRLVDDAAVFPPGDAPLERAMAEHLVRRTGPYAAHLGPLLVRAVDGPEVARLARRDERTLDRPLQVVVVVRPGAPVAPVEDAAQALREQGRVEVVSAELGWSQHWRSALTLGLPLAVEVGTGDEQSRALDDLAAAVDDSALVAAKFRTGETPQWRWPDETALAQFIDATVLRGLTFKLTGGLHHAARQDHDGEPMHGLLNVMVATHEALDGAETDELARILDQRDAALLTDRASRLTAVDVARLRSSFTTFGCCGVLDPLTELEALGLITQEEPS